MATIIIDETITIVPTSELKEMRQEMKEMKALLINLQPTKPEPDPHEPWTAKRIADCCGWNDEVIRRKINRAGIPKLKEKPVTIEYRHIAKLRLKG